jgi:aminopeptidase-like protein
LKWTYKKFKKYSWNDRGSDERQYCAPGIDLPIASVMRSKYGEYPEYHTSLDNLQKVVSPSGLQGSFEVYKKIITALENNCFPKATVLGEPHLSKRGLYSTLSNKSKETIDNERFLLNLLTYSDGQTSLLDIAEKCSAPIWKFYDLVKYLEKMKLLKLKEKKN